MIRLLPVVLVLCLLPAADASGQAGEGTTTIELATGTPLRISAGAGAEAFERRAALPVMAGRRGAREWRLAHRGFITVRGRRPVRLTALEVRVGRRVTVRARVGDRTRTVFTSRARARRETRTGRVRLRGATLRLAPALAARLGTPVISVGRLTIDARLGRGGGSVVEPPARPARAVDVVSGAVSWHLRDSFVQYLNSGEGVRASDGARSGQPTTRPGSPDPLVYDVDLPVRAGWHDPASGLTLLELRGTVGFRYRAHGIDFAVRDAIVELGGGRPARATFRFTGEAGDEFDGSRAPLVDLEPEKARERAVDGRTTTIVEMPGLVPAAKTVFSGFYQPGDPFGWMTVRFTTTS